MQIQFGQEILRREPEFLNLIKKLSARLGRQVLMNEVTLRLEYGEEIKHKRVHDVIDLVQSGKKDYHPFDASKIRFSFHAILYDENYDEEEDEEDEDEGRLEECTSLISEELRRLALKECEKRHNSINNTKVLVEVKEEPKARNIFEFFKKR